MWRKLVFLFYEYRNIFRKWYFDKLGRHFTIKFWGMEPIVRFYGRKKVRNAEYANKWIAEGILSDKPFMVARFGGTESHVVRCILHRRICGFSRRNEKEFVKWFTRLQNWTGFFPNDETLMDRFTNEIISAGENTDVLGTWNRPMEDYLLRYKMKNCKITYLRWLEPWYVKKEKPWTYALEGKKVLVIHPFDESIRKQYINRKKVFPGTNGELFLPDFELITLKAVQTIAGVKDDRFDNWFDALQYMYEQAMKIDFDVAIIGCGSYGMPLASMIKNAGKKAIHLGGVTQCLFGIKGKRWENSLIDKKVPINEDWIYPNENETPSSSNTVEGGCYWK